MKKSSIGFTLIGMLALLLGYHFISSHWEDIQNLFVIALIIGGSFSLAFGGFKIKARR